MNTQTIQLAEIFQSGMVLQRDKQLHLYGTATPESNVSVKIYSKDMTLSPVEGTCKADETGRFLATLPPHSAGSGFHITVSCNDSIVTLEQISFGDIWLAGGQSNMEFFLKYEKNWETTKTLPVNPDIHMFNFPQRAFEGHHSHNRYGYGYWFCADDEGFDMFSAPGFSFAKELQEDLNIPIGIIGCNWGGSTASAWVPEDVLKDEKLVRYLNEYDMEIRDKDPEALKQESLKAWAFEDTKEHWEQFEPLLYGRDYDWQMQYVKEHAGDPQHPMGPYNMNRPSGLYHNMLKKLIPFSIKGVIWYQGESDSGDRAPMYDTLMTKLIEDWRKEWQDDFPFIMVQLAPFGKWLECGNDGYAVVRAQQQKVADHLKDVYLATIMDLGSYYDIHPKEKMEVGRRLALLAKGHVYGEPILCDSPRAKSASVSGHDITVTFDFADGLYKTDAPSDFKVMVNGNTFVPDKIQVVDDKVILTVNNLLISSNDSASVALAIENYSQVNIFNKAGLSAAPFDIRINNITL